MKILFASDCYRFQTGGITTVITTLEKGLRARGHEVKVLALSDGFRSFKDGDSVFIGGYKYIFVPEQRRSFARHTKPLRELAAWKPDIIHAHTEASTAGMARAIAKASGAPLIMTSHSDFGYYIFGPRKDNPVVRTFFRLWGKHAYRGLETMVREINATQVAPGDRLTDNVYHYGAVERVFETAKHFAERRIEKDMSRGSVLKDLAEGRQKSQEHQPRTRSVPERGGAAL